MEAKLQTFRSPGRAEVRKLNFISLAVKAGLKCRSGTLHLRKNWQIRSAERNSCHIMSSQGRAEMRKRNFTSLVVKAVWKRNFRSLPVTTERKCGSGTSGCRFTKLRKIKIIVRSDFRILKSYFVFH